MVYSRFSPSFVETCLRGELRRGEKMPCPKCGHEDVKYTDPRRWLSLAGIFGLIAAGFFMAKMTIPGQVVAVLAAGIAAAVAGNESSYACRHCGHGWRFRDALKWREAIKHDAESGSKGTGQNS